MTDIHTHKTTIVTLSAHARRGLITVTSSYIGIALYNAAETEWHIKLLAYKTIAHLRLIRPHLSILNATLGSLQLAKFSKVILLGDFNVDLSVPLSTRAVDFLSMVNGYGLQQHVDSVTRSSSGTLLDLVLSTCPDLLSPISVVPPLDSSDHSAIEFTLSVIRRPQKVFKRHIWLYQLADFKALNAALENSLPPLTVVAGGDVNSTWSMVRTAFLDKVRRFIPCKKVSCRSSLPPWLTKDVRRLMLKRDRAGRAARKSNEPCQWQAYRRLRNAVTGELRRSKLEFF